MSLLITSIYTFTRAIRNHSVWPSVVNLITTTYYQPVLKIYEMKMYLWVQFHLRHYLWRSFRCTVIFYIRSSVRAWMLAWVFMRQSDDGGIFPLRLQLIGNRGAHSPFISGLATGVPRAFDNHHHHYCSHSWWDPKFVQTHRSSGTVS
jgi:hypothetical protein